MSSQPITTTPPGRPTETGPIVVGTPSVGRVTTTTADTQEEARPCPHSSPLQCQSRESNLQHQNVSCGRGKVGEMGPPRYSTGVPVHGAARGHTQKSGSVSRDRASSNANVVNTQPQATAGKPDTEKEMCKMMGSVHIDDASDDKTHQAATASYPQDDHSTTKTKSAGGGSRLETDNLQKEKHSTLSQVQAKTETNTSNLLVSNPEFNSAHFGETKSSSLTTEELQTAEDPSSGSNVEVFHNTKARIEGADAAQTLSPMSNRNQDTQLFSSTQIKVRFAATYVDSGGSRVTDFPLPVNSDKWQLLVQSKRLEQVTLLKNVGFETSASGGIWTVTYFRNLREDEACVWVNECIRVVWTLLHEIQTALFLGFDGSEIDQLIETKGGSWVLWRTIKSEGTELELFALNSNAMDQILEQLGPFLKDHPKGKMRLKVPVAIELLQSLDGLGFGQHCEQRAPALKMSIDLIEGEILLDSLTDFRKAVLHEIKSFMHGQQCYNLDFDGLRRTLLFVARGSLLRMMKRKGLRCWWRENEGRVELLSKDRFDRICLELTKSMEIISVPLKSLPDWTDFLSDLAHSPGYSSSFCFAPTSDGQHIEIAVVSTVSEHLKEQVYHHITTFPEQQMAGAPDRVCQPDQRSLERMERGSEVSCGASCETSQKLPESQQQTVLSVEASSNPNLIKEIPQEQKRARKEISESTSVPQEIRLDFVIAELLQVPCIQINFKALLSDKGCLLEWKSISKGLLWVKHGHPASVSIATAELFHVEEIKAENDDMEVTNTILSMAKKHTDKLKHCYSCGIWSIGVMADIKGEVHDELERLKTSQHLVHLPLYVLDFIGLKQAYINRCAREEIHSSVNITISEGEAPGVVLSADRAMMKSVTQWFQKFVLRLERKEEKVGLDFAVFLRNQKAQERICGIEEENNCRVDVLNGDQSVLWATSPGGHQVLVCHGSMATTDCDLMVMPLCDGQKEWSPLQRFILTRSECFCYHTIKQSIYVTT